MTQALALGHGSPPSPALQGQALALVAAGTRVAEVAERLGLSHQTIYRWMGANRAIMDSLRASIRARMLECGSELTPELQAWLANLVKVRGKGTAKDVDALTRSLASLEKVAASASGESRAAAQGKVEVVVRFPDWAQAQAEVVDAEPVDSNDPAELAP